LSPVYRKGKQAYIFFLGICCFTFYILQNKYVGEYYVHV